MTPVHVVVSAATIPRFVRELNAASTKIRGLLNKIMVPLLIKYSMQVSKQSWVNSKFGLSGNMLQYMGILCE